MRDYSQVYHVCFIYSHTCGCLVWGPFNKKYTCFHFLFFAEKVVFDLKQKREIISVLAVTESKCDSCAYCVMGYLRGAE